MNNTRVIRVGEPIQSIEFQVDQPVGAVLELAGMSVNAEDEVRINDVDVTVNLDTKVPENAVVMVIQKITGN